MSTLTENDIELPQLHSVAQTAKRLAISEKTVRRLIKSEDLEVVRIRGRVLIGSAAIAAFVKSSFA